MKLPDFRNLVYGDKPAALRLGQHAFNQLQTHRPDLAKRVQENPAIDPFYSDMRLPQFINFLEENWDTPAPNSQLACRCNHNRVLHPWGGGCLKTGCDCEQFCPGDRSRQERLGGHQASCEREQVDAKTIHA